MNDSILLYINGKEHRIRGDAAFESLSRYLRYTCTLTGTKIVCEEGDCGACTVLVGRPEHGALVYRPINSCIQFLYQLHGTHVITVEGLPPNGGVTEVQESMIRNHGAQCGYCTPGFIVAMTSLFDSEAPIDDGTVKEALTGNLCRCTGYEPIIKAALEVDQSRHRRTAERYPDHEIVANLIEASKTPVLIDAGRRKFCAPVDVQSAIHFRKQNPGTVIVQGGTDTSVQANKRGLQPASVLSLAQVAGLDELHADGGMLTVGARVTVASLEEYVRERIPELHRILTLFGSPQIRHAATLAGNIANASPIADTLPFLYVMDAQVEVTGTAGTRLVPIASFYLGYKKLDLHADELITRVIVPMAESDELLRLYKVSKRKDLDISTVTAAFRLRRSGSRIGSAKIAYGGVGPTVLRLTRTEGFLTGRDFSLETFELAGAIARGEITPISDVRGSAEFRHQLAENLMLKFFYDGEGERPGAMRGPTPSDGSALSAGTSA